MKVAKGETYLLFSGVWDGINNVKSTILGLHIDHGVYMSARHVSLNLDIFTVY